MEPVLATTPGATPSKPARPWVVLRSADYRKLFAATNLSLLGDFFSYVALAWLVLQLTGSSLALGGVLVAQAVPRSILMAVGGALVDRLSARLTMLGSMGLRVAVLVPLAILILTGRVQLWEVYVASVVFGVVDSFFMPARSSILPRIVALDELVPANSLMNVAAEVAVVVGPALAGGVVAAFGTGWAFAADAACFTLGVPLVLWLPSPAAGPHTAGKPGQAKTSIAGDIAAGLRYAWNDVGIRALLFIIAAMDLAANGAIGVGLPTLAHGRFAAGATGLGFLLAGWGLGATLGAVLAGFMPHPRRFGLLVCASCAWIGVGVGAIGFMPSLPPAVVVIGLAGFASGLINTYGISWLQGRTEPAMQGRVMSLIFLASMGLVPVGNALSGLVAQVDPTLLFAIAGAIMVGTALGSLTSRSVREL